MHKVTLSILVMASCLTSMDTSAGPPSQKIQKIVIAAVKESLKDPESAKFSDLDSFVAGDLRITCGNVNSKNSFGGYAGKTGFAAMGSESSVFLVQFADKGAPGSLRSICDPVQARAITQKVDEKAASEAEAEKAARCSISTTVDSPGECGHLLRQCDAKFRGLLRGSEFDEYMKLCRRQGFDAATAKWDASLGQTITFDQKK